MSESKRILIVDDDFETVELLRAALAFIDRNIITMGIPSGEEAWIELITTPADLLLVDLNLPGMNGPDLVRKIQNRYPDMPVIIMSGYDIEHMMKESEGLTITRFFEKADDTGRLIDMVRDILYGQLDSLGPYVDVISTDLQNRLEKLFTETEAKRLYLGNPNGEPLFAAGDNLSDYNEAELLSALSQGLAPQSALDSVLNSNDSQLIQVITNPHLEFYTADLSGLGFVTLIFDAQPQRARISTVWVFMQRAIPDLIAGLLSQSGEAPAETGTLDPASLPAVDPAETAKIESATVATAPAVPAGPTVPDLPAGEKFSFEEAVAKGLIPNLFAQEEEEEIELDLGEADEFDDLDIDLFGDLDEGTGNSEDWNDLLELTPDPADLEVIEDLQLEEMSEPSSGGDDFWSSAAESTDENAAGRFSLEDAIKQGLIPGNLFND